MNLTYRFIFIGHNQLNDYFMDFKTKISVYFLTLLVSVFADAQEKKASPAESVSGKINGSEITINYGSPSVRGRVIWGELVPFDKVWRAGANDATTFETTKDITVAGQKLPAGKYSFYIIPGKDTATIIFNNDAKQWGAYSYKEKKDQLRVMVKPILRNENAEKLIYTINKDNVTLSWEKWDILVPVK